MKTMFIIYALIIIILFLTGLLNIIPLGEIFFILFSFYSAKFWFKSATMKLSPIIDLQNIYNKDILDKIPDAGPMFYNLYFVYLAFFYCRNNFKTKYNDNIFEYLKVTSLYNATAAVCMFIGVIIYTLSRIVAYSITIDFFKDIIPPWNPQYTENFMIIIFITGVLLCSYLQKPRKKPSTPEA